ncbi:MAG: phage tail terminator family protein [Syntrophomonadaceae bacterium]|jgi:hypothetical protein
MINDIKQAIAQKIHEQYPSAAIYDEDIPQNFKTPSFLVTVIEQNYGKRLDNKYNSTVSFDVAYFSDKEKNETKSDCQAVQVNLLRAFELVGTFRVQNLQATIVDNVLHITFDVRYSEIKTGEEIPKMQDQATNTDIKE